MPTIVELYETLKESIGEKAAKLLTQELDKLESVEKYLEILEKRLSSLENQ